MQLTVINMTEWSLLYADQKLVNQGHETSIRDLIIASQGNPIILKQIDACDSQLDHLISETGDFNENTQLSDVLPMIGEDYVNNS